LLTETQIKNIPKELKEKDQWVGFKLEDRGGDKFEKIPINPHTGKNASTSDVNTWGSFDETLERVKKDDLPGAGFVFSGTDNFIGIDFDRCLDAKKRQLDTQVIDWLNRLNSYCEVSPSAAGVKLIVKGSIPSSSCGEICEMYFDKRFFTITGLRLPGYPATINTCDGVVEELYKANGGGSVDAVDKRKHFGWQDEKVIGVTAMQRHDTALSLAGRWYKKGFSPEEIAFFLSAWNEKNDPPKQTLKDPYGKEIQDILAHVMQKQSGVITEEIFPRTSFPWDILPPSLVDSFKQLARSYATSPNSLPGAAVAILASVLGSTISVKPKASWKEPLIIWACDIRESGEGKIVARALSEVLEFKQRQADEEYRVLMNEYEMTPKGERGAPPPPARGYLVTDLTLEGLAKDLNHHGGKVCVLDEMSYFINSQNQYKGGKGSDRESWLRLHDGKMARIVRSSGNTTISGARVSIFGGIQPNVWRDAFKLVFNLQDGTVFRLLPTIEGNIVVPLTTEVWADENRAVWENLINFAVAWADSVFESKKYKKLPFDRGAFELFMNWRNDLYGNKRDRLSRKVRGFIPKAVGYAARFAGILHCMNRFMENKQPGDSLSTDEVKRGIRMVEFYLGHAIEAAEILVSDYDLLDSFEQEVLGIILSLKDQIEDKRLPTYLIAAELGIDPDNRSGLTKIGMAAKVLGLTTRVMPDGKKRCFYIEPEDLEGLEKWNRRPSTEIPPIEDLTPLTPLTPDQYIKNENQRDLPPSDPQNPEKMYIDQVSKVSKVSKLIRGAEEMKSLQKRIYGGRKMIKKAFMDTETSGLDPLNDRLILIQLMVEDEIFLIDVEKTELSSSFFPELMEDKNSLKVFHNAIFDVKFLKKHIGGDVNNIFDTFLSERLLTAGILPIKELGLKDLAKKYLNIDLDKSLSTSFKPGQGFTEEQLKYAEKDASVLKSIFEIQKKKLVNQRLANVALLEFDIIPAVADIELRGALIDIEKLDSLKANLEKRLEEIGNSLRDIVNEAGLNDQGELFNGSGINLRSPQQIKECLNKLGFNVESTGKEVLKKIDHPFAKLLRKHRKASKLLSSFVLKLPDHINEDTGRIHPEFLQLGTDTGRFSCQKPNLQQIPKEQECSQDPVFLEAYEKDEDFHQRTADLIGGSRDVAKTINFGLCYGMGSKGLAERLGLKQKEAQDFITRYFKAYPQVKNTLDKLGLMAVTRRYSETPLGRKRYFKPADSMSAQKSLERKGRNSPIQATCGDILKRAIQLLSENLKGYDVGIVNLVHDEIVVECRDDLVKDVSKVVNDCMVQAGEDSLKSVPVKVDMVVDKKWRK
jgi:DNA polymerase I-like protein with 3'-5' exonuclease and polymerase domains